MRPAMRALRWLLLALILMLAAPYALTPVYAVVNPVSTLMLWRWLTGRSVERIYVPIGEIAPALPVTVIGSEDGRFCTHAGVDWKEIREAIDDADDLTEARGGSTLTQQVAKNLFLWPSRSLVRKALELPLAYWIDLVLSKRRIMEIYLNVAEWAPGGRFGAEAGARYAFGKSSRNLDAREAALLAAILPNPIVRSARRPGPSVRRLAATYEARARANAAGTRCLLR